MALRLIGTATTDVNGNAVLEDGYTGSGAGEVDIIAKTVIDDSIFQSETYEVWDTIYYDTGLDDGTANDIWNYDSKGTITRQSDGTLLELTGTASNNFWLIDNTKRHSPNFVIELDIVSRVYRNQLGLFKDNTDRIDLEFNGYDGGLGHWRIEVTPTSQKAYLNGTLKAEYTKNFDTNIRIALYSIYADNTSSKLKFKNFKIYSI